jgi:hypothetical protein
MEESVPCSEGILWILRTGGRRLTCRTAIRRVKRPTVGFSSTSASACCEANSKSSSGTARLKSGSAGSVHR